MPMRTISTLPPLPLPSIGTVDRDFLDSIQRNFYSAKPEGQALTLLIVVMALAILLFALALVLPRIVAAIRGPRYPEGWVFDPKKVRAMLQDVVDRRSKLEIRFHAESGGATATFCSPVELGDEGLVMEMNAPADMAKSWVGRDIHCFFRVMEPRKKATIFYTFRADIVTVKGLAEDLTHLTVALPDRLELYMQRHHLRIDPPTDTVLGLALWPVFEERRQEMEENFKAWGKPRLYLAPGKAASIGMENLSAGGVRVRLEAQAAKEAIPARGPRAPGEVHIRDEFFCLMNLFDPEEDEKLTYWLRCRVQNLYEDYATKDLELGMRFMARAEVLDKATGELVWMPVAEGGMESLAQWVMRRHLTMFREKGVAE